MSWVCLEGIDRSGKSTVANMYKAQGYEYVHLDAPDKKYAKEGYTGPSYLDEMLDMYMSYTGKDVIFDRTPYGEFVWPLVFGRDPLLSADDVEVLQDIEDQNDAQRILMSPKDSEAHWQRCVNDDEPLTLRQFTNASKIYDNLVHKFSFEKKSLEDFSGKKEVKKEIKKELKKEPTKSPLVEEKEESFNVVFKTADQLKLDKANAINQILNKPILKKKSEVFQSLESDIKEFLEAKLAVLLGSGASTKTETGFSKEEVQILKMHCQVMKQRSK